MFPSAPHLSGATSAAAERRMSSVPAVLLSGPVPIAAALKQVGSRLRPRDLSEALALPPSRVVYYLGRPAVVDRQSVTGRGSTALETLMASQGKTEEGQYGPIRPGDQIDWRYEVRRELGRGSFGIVVECFDHKTKLLKAIKIVNALPRYTNQAKTEMQLMETIRDAEMRERRLTIAQYGLAQVVGASGGEGVGATSGAGAMAEGGGSSSGSSSKDSVISHHLISLEHAFKFRGHLCLVMPLGGSDLFSQLKRGGFVGMPLQQVRTIAAQMLEALIFLHRLRIIHGDLKPENVLSSGSASASGGAAALSTTLIDLGSSCYDGKQVFSYIGSRFYRAPEVILQLHYSNPMDIWAFGVMLPELLTGRPLFPGEDEAEQLALIQQVLGMPPNRMLNASPPATRSRYYELVEPEDGAGGAGSSTAIGARGSSHSHGKETQGKEGSDGKAASAGVGSGMGLLSRHRAVGTAQPYYRPLNLVNSKGRKRGVGSRTLREVVEAYLRAAASSAATQSAAAAAAVAAQPVSSSSSSAQPHQHLSVGDPQMQLFMDFVAMIIQWDPKARPTPLEASRHPFVRDLMPSYLYDPECVAASIGSLAFASTSGSSSNALVPAPRPQFNFDARLAAGGSPPSLAPSSALSPLGRHSLSVGPNASGPQRQQQQQQGLGAGVRQRRRLSSLNPSQSPRLNTAASIAAAGGAGTALGQSPGMTIGAGLQGSRAQGNDGRRQVVPSSQDQSGFGAIVGTSSIMLAASSPSNALSALGAMDGGTNGNGHLAGTSGVIYQSRGRTLHRAGVGVEKEGTASLIPRPPPSGDASAPKRGTDGIGLSPLPPRAQAVAAGWAGAPGGNHHLLSLTGAATIGVGSGVGGGGGARGLASMPQPQYTSALVTTSLSPIGVGGGVPVLSSSGSAYGLGPPLPSSSSSNSGVLGIRTAARAAGGLGGDGSNAGSSGNSLSSTANNLLRGHRGGLASVPPSYRLSTGHDNTAAGGAGSLSVIPEETSPLQRRPLGAPVSVGPGSQPTRNISGAQQPTPQSTQAQPWQRRRQQYYQDMIAGAASSSSPSPSQTPPSSSYAPSPSLSLSSPAASGSGGIRQALMEARAAAGGGDHSHYYSSGGGVGGSGTGMAGPKASYSYSSTLSPPSYSASTAGASNPSTAGFSLQGMSSIPRLAPANAGGGSSGGDTSKSIGRLLAAARQIAGPSATMMTASAAGGSPESHR